MLQGRARILICATVFASIEAFSLAPLGGLRNVRFVRAASCAVCGARRRVAVRRGTAMMADNEDEGESRNFGKMKETWEKWEESWAMSTLKLGIKAVGVGVSGSKPIQDELATDLAKVVHASLAPPPEWAHEHDKIRQRLASFLGTLFVKVEHSGGDLAVLAAVAAAAGPSVTRATDRVREGCSSSQIIKVAAAYASDSPELEELTRRLLDGHTLSAHDAYRLGTFLFSLSEPAELQVMCAHILRVRYETDDEWVGLLKAQHAACVGAGASASGGERQWRVVQIAEPFDGTHKAESFAPLIAWHLQDKWGLIAVSHTSASAGPKYGPNLLNLAHALSPETILGKADMGESLSAKVRGLGAPRFGYFVDHGAVYPCMARWQVRQGIRRNVLKRPFLATAEKLVDSHQARILVASAFHPSFSDKMFTMIEGGTGFDGCIIVRRGCEGSLGLSLARPADFTCGIRQADGRLKRMQFSFAPQDAGVETQPETALQSIKDFKYPEDAPRAAEATAAKIQAYALAGASEDDVFDARVKVTLKAMDVALEWVLNGRLIGPAARQNAVEPAAFDGKVNTWGDSGSFQLDPRLSKSSQGLSPDS